MTAMSKTLLQMLMIDDNPENGELYRRFLSTGRLHELKTPLTVIAGYLAILLDGLAASLNKGRRVAGE